MVTRQFEHLVLERKKLTIVIKQSTVNSNVSSVAECTTEAWPSEDTYRPPKDHKLSSGNASGLGKEPLASSPAARSAVERPSPGCASRGPSRTSAQAPRIHVHLVVSG